MSEYQYYRFERLQGLLNQQQRADLRNLSSRAEITATSFQVFYHYAGLKADPVELMLSYFDIGFYYADWGTVDVYFKLPAGTLPPELMNLETYGFITVETEQWQLLICSFEEYGDYFEPQQIEDFYQHLSGLHAGLLLGDWRLIYLMWLRCWDEDSQIDPLPRIDFDFIQLNDAHRAFISLFEIPPEFVKALSLTLQAKPGDRFAPQTYTAADWLRQLSGQDKDHLLTQLFEQGQLTREQALIQTREKQLQHPPVKNWIAASELAPFLEIAQEQYKLEQAQALLKRQEYERAERVAALAKIYLQREQIWQQVQHQANRACASGYDSAAADLYQLAEAHQQHETFDDFARQFRQFLLKNNGRKALLSRLQGLIDIS